MLPPAPLGASSACDGCECSNSKKASSRSGVSGIMSTNGPQATSVGGGKEHVGRGGGGGARITFLEDLGFGGVGVNFTLRLFFL